MPFPTEHAARVRDPKDFEWVKDLTEAMRKKGWTIPAGVRVLGGKIKGQSDEWSVQTWRFNSASWTPEKAKAWLKKEEHKHIGFENATEASLVIQAGKALQHFQGLGRGTTSTGAPYRDFVKELCRVGHYGKLNPDTEEFEFEFDVTPEMIHHWPAVFEEMRTNGVAVPVPLGHVADEGTKKGEVTQMWAAEEEGTARLYGVIRLVGEDNIKLADTYDVSVFSPPSWPDGKGNLYLRPIVHVALTEYPVVSGMAGFEAIGASLLQGVPLVISLCPAKSSQKEVRTMDRKRLVLALGFKPEDVTEDEKGDELIFSKIGEVMKGLQDAKAATAAAVKAAQDEGEKKAADIRASLAPKKPDPAVVTGLASVRRRDLKDLVLARKVSPVVAGKLEAIFVGPDKKTDALELSLSHPATDNFSAVVSALALNEVKDMVKTGVQILELSQTPRTEPTALEKDAAKRAGK